MSKMQILAATLHVALRRIQDGHTVDEHFLTEQDKKFKALVGKYPEETRWASLKLDEPPIDDPWKEIEVEVSPAGIRRVLPPFERLVDARLNAIKEIVADAIRTHAENVRNVVSVLGEWMRKGTIVRVIGAGRALLAGSLPANRLAHGGAAVWVLGDRSPLPNSRRGGGIIAASASGATPIVLEIMALAQKVNKERVLLGEPEIIVIGVSNRTSEKAKEFRSLCTPGFFLGIQPEPWVAGLELRALGDIEEYSISELLDAVVVLAGLEIGVNFRLGHEDLVGGATGPWDQHKRS